MTISRGWTWIKEDEKINEDEIDNRTRILNILAAKWSELKTQEEEEGFAREAAIEERGFYGPEEFDSDEEEKEYHARQEARVMIRNAEISAIEEKMEELGARIMRPYEHWNEDEKLMEYMERDRY